MAIPDWKLERILLGEESGEGLGPDDRARLEALRASNEDVLGRYPPKLVASRIEAELRRGAVPARPREARVWFRPVLVAAPALAGLAAVFLLARPGQDAVRPLEPEVTREKGDIAPVLLLHRRIAGKVERLSPGAAARAGDVLQLSYAAAGAKHGVIVSVDGGGAVTLHQPAREGLSTALAGEDETPLADAYELDAAPGFERFFLVTAGTPIDVASVLAAARTLAADPARARTAALALAPGLRQTSFLLVKP
jgi:hypothetical protein